MASRGTVRYHQPEEQRVNEIGGKWVREIRTFACSQKGCSVTFRRKASLLKRDDGTYEARDLRKSCPACSAEQKALKHEEHARELRKYALKYRQRHS